jgi:ABC-type phosphate transport system substrate-binding protein
MMNIQHRRLTLPLTVVLLLAAGTSQAGELIANASVTLTADEFKEVFLGDKQLAGGAKLVPVDNAAAQADFLSKVMQSDGTKYAARWTKKSFREGLTAPAVKGSDAEVIAFVKSTPGAVGYVSGTSSGVKVISKY